MSKRNNLNCDFSLDKTERMNESGCKKELEVRLEAELFFNERKSEGEVKD